MASQLTIMIDGARRALTAQGRIIAGESVAVSVDGMAGAAATLRLALVSPSRQILAACVDFTVDGTAATGTMATNTAELKAYLASVPTGRAVQVACLVWPDVSGYEAYGAGVVEVVAEPMPTELAPVPTVTAYVTEAEMDAAIAAAVGPVQKALAGVAGLGDPSHLTSIGALKDWCASLRNAFSVFATAFAALLLALPCRATTLENLPLDAEMLTSNETAQAIAAATNGLLRAESDPTVPAWAKSAQPPAVVEYDPVFSAWADDPASVFAGAAATASQASSADYASQAGSADYAYTANSADTAASADSASTAGYSEEAGHASGASHAEEAVGLYWTSGDGTLYTASEIVAVATNRAPVSSTSAARWATGVLSLEVPANGTLSADLAGWPDGGAVFVRLSASGAYTVAPSLSLLGYGSWPTNSASCVAVRDGARVLVTVLEGR